MVFFLVETSTDAAVACVVTEWAVKDDSAAFLPNRFWYAEKSRWDSKTCIRDLVSKAY
jgi:hypothetical protein